MKALVVDGDKAIRGLLKKTLARMGLETLEADCDDEILKSLVYVEGIGIAVIDVGTDTVDCRRVCEEIKRHWPYVKLIVTSEEMPELDEKVFKGLGVSAFLKKPYELSDVRDAMSQALGNFNIPQYE
jgi:DNA-binding response OmpR family regulator